MQALCILQDMLQKFPYHLFVARWQQSQFVKSRKNPGEDMIFVQDFAANLLLSNQDEAQSAYWGHYRVSIHPIIAVYLCQVCKQIVKSEFIVLSDDLKHDHEAVNTFQEAVEENLAAAGVVMNKKVTYSDGCGMQYKSKHTFYHMAQESVQQTRVYYGSGHGKSLCDAATGVLKRNVKDAIKARNLVVTGAKSLFAHGQKVLAKEEVTKQGCTHILRAFLLCNDIKRPKRPVRKTVPGTKSFHVVRNNPQVPGQIICDELACMCLGCKSGGKCENPEVTEDPALNPRKVVQLWNTDGAIVPKRSGRKRKLPDDEEWQPSSVMVVPCKKPRKNVAMKRKRTDVEAGR